jgi:hypothetical protein
VSKLITSKVPSSLASAPNPDRSRQSQPCPQEGRLPDILWRVAGAGLAAVGCLRGRARYAAAGASASLGRLSEPQHAPPC